MKKRLIAVAAGMLLMCACSRASEPVEPEQIKIEIQESEEASTDEIKENSLYEPFSIEVKKEVYKLINERAEGRDGKDALESIRDINTKEAAVWDYILPYWENINEEDFVYEEILPDGLPEDNSLCIIVMGYQLNPDGSMREELVGRVTTALNCANKYKNAYVLVTGGGTASSNRNATEADMMAEWLMENGVDESRIVIENKSMTSADNALYSYRILRDSYPEVESAVIVTSEYHVPLGCLLFEYQFETAAVIDGDKKIDVISNAAYMSGSSSHFSLDGQGYWLRALTDIQQ